MFLKTTTELKKLFVFLLIGKFDEKSGLKRELHRISVILFWRFYGGPKCIFNQVNNLHPQEKIILKVATHMLKFMAEV